MKKHNMDYKQSWKDKIPKKSLGRNGFNRRSLGQHKKNLLNFIFSRGFLKIFSWLLALLLLSGIVLFVWASRDLPSPNQLINRQVAQSTKIYDRTGQHVLYDIHGDKQRTLVELKDIPSNVKNATIAIEDKSFYSHPGFSWTAILRTAVTDVLFHKSAGASTLTQQFVKNSILSSQKTFTRKIKELILAYRIEQKFTKDQILQMYLNEIPYGSTAYGVQAASQKYFNKDIQNVDLAEAAVLAALPQSPSYYSPYGGHKDILLGRQKYVLDLMAEQGYITKDEATKAKSEEIKFAKQNDSIIAPHFVMYVKELLTEKYGQEMVEQGGLKIYTTLDLDKQQIAEQAIDDWWNNSKVVDKKTGQEAEYNKYGASNAALVSIDPKTGQVLAMVGSRDYFNDQIDGQVNIATAQRQPGSSLKPLVYSALFNKGYTPNTLLYDVETNFSSDPAKPYIPLNYTLKEYGPIKIKNALAGSLNIPAVKATYLAGLDDIISLAKKFGYTTLDDKDRFGLSFALGGAEVKLLEHTDAYGVFATEGKYNPPAVILKVQDKDGKTLEEWKQQTEDVLDSNVAREISDILSDNSNRAFVFGTSNYLILKDRLVAAKTGTTNDFHDAWTMGYTPSLVTGVWTGNSDNKEMKKGSDGSVVAAPIWNEYMRNVLSKTPVETFTKPEIALTGKAVLDGQLGGQIVKIDKASGLLATSSTPPEMIEDKIFNQPHDILFYVDRSDPLGPAPADPNKDPQFIAWEKGVQDWVKKQVASSTASTTKLFNLATSSAPTAYDNIHIPANKPSVSIIHPSNNETITSPLLSVDVQASAPRGLAKIKYYLNDNLFAEKTGGVFNLINQNIDFLNNGYQNLKVSACDDADNCADASIEINVLLNRTVVNQDFNISLVSPSSGLAVNNIDFPLAITFQTTNPKQIAKIDVYNKKDGADLLLGTIYPAGEKQSSFFFKNPLQSGPYHLFGKAYSWSGQVKQTSEITINVTSSN